MNIDAQKSEIINWISRLKDHRVIQEIIRLKKTTERQEEQAAKKASPRAFGSGKHLISYIADDFSDPIDHFGDDTKP